MYGVRNLGVSCTNAGSSYAWIASSPRGVTRRTACEAPFNDCTEGLSYLSQCMPTMADGNVVTLSFMGQGVT
jgi:hypothetical protein